MAKADKPITRDHEGTVCVALATDSKYLAPALVTVQSIVRHAAADHRYALFILSETPLSPPARSLFLSTIRNKPHVTLSFIAVGDRIGDVKLSENGPIKGVTQATYFRFLLPTLLADTDTVLYMDADTVALDDVARICQHNMDGCYVAGVRDCTGYENARERCEELQIDSLDQYVNAGVLLFNLKAFRDNDLSSRMLALATTRCFPYNDQDIINSVCYGNITRLPYRCNVIVDFLEDPQEISRALNVDYIEETSDPIVLHYAGRAKPWYHPQSEWSAPWWDTVSSLGGMARFLFGYYLRRLWKKPRRKR